MLLYGNEVCGKGGYLWKALKKAIGYLLNL